MKFKTSQYSEKKNMKELLFKAFNTSSLSRFENWHNLALPCHYIFVLPPPTPSGGGESNIHGMAEKTRDMQEKYLHLH